MSIGPVIASLRTRRGLTQAELALELGVEDSTVSRWESDDTFPRKRHLDALAAALGVTTAELFGQKPSNAEMPAADNDL